MVVTMVYPLPISDGACGSGPPSAGAHPTFSTTACRPILQAMPLSAAGHVADIWSNLQARPRRRARLGLVVLSLLGSALLWATVRIPLEWRETIRDHGQRHEHLSMALIRTHAEIRALQTLVTAQCDTTTVRALVRQSLSANDARRFFVRYRGDERVCGPLGADASVPAATRSHPVPSLVLSGLGAARSLHVVYPTEAYDVIAELGSDVAALLDAPVSNSRFRWVHAIVPAAAPSHQQWLGIQTVLPNGMLWATRLDGTSIAVGVQRDWAWVLLIAVIGLLIARLALQKAVFRRVSADHRLRRAVRKRRFEPWIQPIVRADTREIVGGEVLMRWAHPARGILPPSDFIALAEATDLIRKMSEIVMVKARDRLASTVQQQPDLYISFNITPRELVDPGLVARLIRVFDDESLPRHQVLLEVTERDLVEDTAVDTLHALRAAGFRIAIDDFGTGHSSLSLLERVPADKLKIDRAFVQNIGEDDAPRPVLDAIITMAHGIGLPLIAEGVETEAQHRYLSKRGVQCIQGFLHGRPMPLDDFARLAAPAEVLGEGHTPVSLDGLVFAMEGPGGVAVRNRWYRMRRYPRCFVASEAVTWLQTHLGVTRERAVRVGERLTAMGQIEHVMEEHDFKDEYLFFHVRPSLFDQNAHAGRLPDVALVIERLRRTAHPVFGAASEGLLRFDAVCRGDRLTAWIEGQFRLAREDALLVGEVLMRRGALVHVFDDRPFAATRDLYRMAPERDLASGSYRAVNAHC